MCGRRRWQRLQRDWKEDGISFCYSHFLGFWTFHPTSIWKRSLHIISSSSFSLPFTHFWICANKIILERLFVSLFLWRRYRLWVGEWQEEHGLGDEEHFHIDGWISRSRKSAKKRPNGQFSAANTFCSLSFLSFGIRFVGVRERERVHHGTDHRQIVSRPVCHSARVPDSHVR